MTPDPHDDYYDRRTLHRQEMIRHLGRPRVGRRFRRIVAVAAALLLIAAPASADWLGLFR